MKKIDKLVLNSFAGPFTVSFGIALFVLIMQFLWLYIDEIAGKGVSTLVLIELIGYLSISTFPMALPIAMLIASVMVMGTLAERYELSSMKSAGISLLRVMRSLILSALAIGLFSYLCSDFLIPLANLKFKSRLYDIRKQKPALTLEEGVFNEDFRQFVIRIGKKDSDGETIGNIQIEDQSNPGRLIFNQVLADSGQMFTTDDKRFFVMKLFNGTQYQQPGSAETQRGKYPFTRVNFTTWTKIWDMQEFEMTRTDDERFKAQRSMLGMRQLRANIDSIRQVVRNTEIAVAKELVSNVKREPVKPIVSLPPKPPKGGRLSTTATARRQEIKALADKAAAAARTNQGLFTHRKDEFRQQLDKPIHTYTRFAQTFPAACRTELLKEARFRSGSYRNVFNPQKSLIENRKLEVVKTGYELYTKYSFALICFIFLFIGAPMGAIIRKGGFGYPVLVSIIFFVMFVMLTILCRKFAELYILTPFWAAMLPCLLLAPIAALLTVKAMNDSQMVRTDKMDRVVQFIIQRVKKIKPA